MPSITQTINGTAHQIESSPSSPRAELIQDLATAVASLATTIDNITITDSAIEPAAIGVDLTGMTKLVGGDGTLQGVVVLIEAVLVDFETRIAALESP